MANSSPKFSTKEALILALAEIARHTQTPLALDKKDRCTFQIGKFPAPVTIDWIESARCVAVHAAALPMLSPEDSLAAAAQLLGVHALGAITLGCQFWRMPDGQIRVGAMLYGPSFTTDELLEVIGRVAQYSAKVQSAPLEKAREDAQQASPQDADPLEAP